MTRSAKRSRRSRPSKSSESARPITCDVGEVDTGLARVIAEAFLLCAPPPRLTLSEWSDAHRVLSPEGSAEPGQWRTSRNEPLRGIMDAVTDPIVEDVVVIKGTQVGYTEGVVLNALGYHIDVDPCPILLLLPTDKVVDEISKNRLTPMLRDTPRLRDKVRAPRSRDSANTIAGKSFPGGRLAMVGANSPSDLASRPIRLVIADEIDKFPASAGVEGDPLTLAAKRQETFWNRKTIKGSSPTVKGISAVEREYKLSDMRELWVACPHCREKQTLKWSQVRWDKRTDKETGKPVHVPESAAYQCEHCGVLWDDTDRFLALSRVKPDDWRPTAPFRGIAGFKLSQLYSSYVKLGKVVTEFLTAYGKLPNTYPNPQLMKVFTNTVLAETWEEQGETVDKDGLSARAEPYGPDDLPAGVAFATAAIDVQGDRLEIQIVGWGAADESWAIAYVVLPGDPAQGHIWLEADAVLRRVYMTREGRKVRVMATAVDTGGHHAAQVYAFCKARRARRVYPIKGANGPRPIWPPRWTRAKNNEHVYIVGVDTAKDAIYGRLKIPPRNDPDDLPNPGFIHFPLPEHDTETAAFDTDYYAQLTVERVETRYREGKPYRVWVKAAGARNEALDTFAYALAARQSLPFKIRGGATAIAEPPPDPDAAQQPPPAASVPRPTTKPAAAVPSRPAAPQPVMRAPGVSRGAALARKFRGY